MDGVLELTIQVWRRSTRRWGDCLKNRKSKKARQNKKLTWKGLAYTKEVRTQDNGCDSCTRSIILGGSYMDNPQLRTFPKCRARIHYTHVGPLFWKCPNPQGLYPPLHDLTSFPIGSPLHNLTSSSIGEDTWFSPPSPPPPSSTTSKSST